MKNVLISFSVLLLIGCSSKTDSTRSLPANERGVPQYNEVRIAGIKMITVGGKHNVWTKKVGNGAIKVLLLHGGPGATHEYFECFEDFLPQAGIEFYYYDQLGVGNSDFPSDTSLWNLPRYVEEVEEVRKGLGLEQFYLLGHSWGGMLSIEYMQRYQSHVKGLVISNMVAGMDSYGAYVEKLKSELFSEREIRLYDSLDKLGDYGSAAYQDLLMRKLYANVFCRLDPWPEPLQRTFKHLNGAIYMQMQGVDEFHVTGNFKNWERWDQLSNIKVPTLVIGGEKDEMNPEEIRREGTLIPNSRTYLCPNGSHMSMWDDQQNYFNNLVAFLKDVEERKFVADGK